ncbi:class I SAM-dependent methyltransferase [Mycobacterium sp. KBS0706]|uniref:class I SAM-dependent methyltransferase n=1 Tax=Mycobacterium sp. KBS0706 TaxID=2578109 RepID=UPI00110F8D70|nr:class I SAM-dependent methyltransferase [Mycobacterium sp. KBS0706]TSD85420.1 class I SAM-dependent methyltransferase [Mycobacterium sp. KBS0706]
MTTIPFTPRRFRTAAAHYLQGRPAYAAGLFPRIARTCGLGGEHRVLDLGCGPGQIAVALAPFAGEVVGIDPEPEMLAVAAETAERAGVRVALQQGSSYDLGPELGRFRLVTMGRSFHWMDRVETLRRLDAMIDPEGAVVLIHDDHPKVPDNRWVKPFRDLIERYAGGDSARAMLRSTDWLNHTAVLLDSPFSRLEEVAVIERRRIPTETLIDRALSMSGTAPDRIGDRVTALIAEIEGLMAEYEADGMVAEVVTSSALIARRPETE